MSSRGSILVTALWIVLILAILSVSIWKASSMELRFSKYSMDNLYALYMAKAGLAKAAGLIAKDGSLLETREDGELEKGEFGYEIRDEERRFNARIDRTASSGIFRYREILKGLSDKLNNDTVNAIIDWQDIDSEPLAGGAERAYYENLAGPYACKNSPLEYVEELLLVKGVEREIFEEVKDYITVYGSGKININTASFKVLKAVMGADGKYDNLVTKIIKYRKGPDGREGTADDRRITRLGPETESAMGLTPLETGQLSLMAGHFVYKSKNFRVTSYGRSNGVTRVITCVIERPDESNQDNKIQYYHEN